MTQFIGQYFSILLSVGRRSNFLPFKQKKGDNKVLQKHQMQPLYFSIEVWI